jgi:hypothetical protein
VKREKIPFHSPLLLFEQENSDAILPVFPMFSVYPVVSEDFSFSGEWAWGRRYAKRMAKGLKDRAAIGHVLP